MYHRGLPGSERSGPSLERVDSAGGECCMGKSSAGKTASNNGSHSQSLRWVEVLRWAPPLSIRASYKRNGLLCEVVGCLRRKKPLPERGRPRVSKENQRPLQDPMLLRRVSGRACHSHFCRVLTTALFWSYSRETEHQRRYVTCPKSQS